MKFLFVVCFALSSTQALLSPWKNSFASLSAKSIHKSLIKLSFSTTGRIRVPSILKFRVATDNENEEEWTEIETESSSSGSTTVLKRISKNFVPLAVSVGFAVTPSPSIAARFAGAAAGGVAGLVLKTIVASRESKEEEQEFLISDSDGTGGRGSHRSGVSTRVATALDILLEGPPLDTLTLNQIEKAAKQAKVPANCLSELFTELFAEVVYQALMTESEDFTELSGVIDFVETMKLKPQEVGDGFVLAMTRVGETSARDEQGFFTEDSYSQLLPATKAIFIGEKLIGLKGYYGKRLLVSLSLFPMEDYNELITRTCTNLFRRSVEAVLRRPKDYLAYEIEKLREFLTCSPEISSFRPASMQGLIMEILQFTLDKSLQGPDAKIEDMERLQQAQEVLGWNPREFKETLEVRTMPIFEKDARKIIQEVTEQPSYAEEYGLKLKERANSLNIDVSKAKVLLTTIVSDKNYEYMNMIDRVYNSSGGAVEPAFKIMATYTTQHNAMAKVLDTVLGNISDIPIPGLPFAEMVRASMYKLQLESGSDAVKGELFDLNDEQKRIVRMNLALPKISGWITQCISENNFNEGARGAYEKLLTLNGVTPEQWKATSIDFYYQEAKKVAEARRVPTEADMNRLKEIQQFLSCPDESVQKVALELFGDKFVKALSESMMPTGVITSEYLDGLERLRDRLTLSTEDAKKLVAVAVRQRMVPVVKDLVDQWKIAIGVKQRKDESKDKSGDPIADQDNVLGYMETGSQKEGGGPNVFMRESLNLIDFVEGNYEVLDIDFEAMPVTASGIVPTDELSSMFKHYLITRLTEQDPALKQRYIDNEVLFAKILGIHPDDQIRIRESLAYTACKNILKNIFRYKDGVEPQDLTQASMLRENLGIEEETAEKIFTDASRSSVLELAANLFLRQKNQGKVITADVIQRFRKQVQSLSLSLKNDAGFNDKLLAYLFTVEVQYLIENGLESELQDLQESYEIPVERAEPIVAAACRRYVTQLMGLALRAARKYKEQDCVKYVKEILKYAQFFEGPVDADGLMFSEVDKERLISFYETESNLESLGPDSPEHDVVIQLRNLIRFDENFVPPKHGLDGFLVGDPSELVKAKDDLGDMKKRWAWN